MIKIENVRLKDLCSLAFLVLLTLLYGCGEKYYDDEKTGLVVKELGEDLNNHWALKGVIVDAVKSGYPAHNLISAGELISCIVTERKVTTKKQFRSAIEDALEDDKTVILRISKEVNTTSLDDLGVKLSADPEERGVFIDWVKPRGGADKAGIKPNTLVYSINGQSVKSPTEFESVVSEQLRNGTKLIFNIARQIVVKKRNETGIEEVDDAAGGVVIKEMKKLELEGSPASMEGISVGDLITHVIDEIKVEDIKSYKKGIKKATGAERVVFKRGEIGGLKLIVIEAIGEIRDNRAVEPLLKALKSSDRWIRRAAAKGLKDLDDPRIIPQLSWHISEANEPDPEVRLSAVEALSRLKTSEAIELLAQALKDSSLNVRLLAGDALGKMGISAINVLLQASRDPDIRTRDIAVAALGKIVDEKGQVPQVVKSELKSILNNDKEETTIKLTAIQSLYRMGDPDAIAELRKVATSGDPQLRPLVNELLGGGNI